MFGYLKKLFSLPGFDSPTNVSWCARFVLLCIIGICAGTLFYAIHVVDPGNTSTGPTLIILSSK
jgi:hypothetical protein